MACVGLGQILGNPLARSAVSRLSFGSKIGFQPISTAFLARALYYFRRFNYGDGQELVKDMIFDHRIGTQKVAAPFQPRLRRVFEGEAGLRQPGEDPGDLLGAAQGGLAGMGKTFPTVLSNRKRSRLGRAV
jgi:hypothetical protein